MLLVTATRLILSSSRLVKQRLKTTVYLYSTLSIVNKSVVDKMRPTNPSILKRYDNIAKSAEDKRTYRGLVLENNMKVLLISDPTTDKSAASLDVNIGYLSDPDDIPGLAHFCEHMLFLGTEKYPNENDYNKFLSEHGGVSNAATYSDHTNYYFDVVPEHLADALDRFSQFFLNPLFTEAATDRELNAVNSENHKNLSSDIWRIDQLDKHLAKSDHPYHKFGTGNKLTLDDIPKSKGINVRDALLKFHDQWYSSNIMAFAVLGKETLDELEELVISLFSSVKDKGVKVPIWDENPFDTDAFKTYIYMVPIKDVRNLNIIFPCPDLTEYYKSAPAAYLSNLLGHEGPGSLLSALKDRGWSNNLVAGNRPAPRGLGFFGVSVDLTEDGMNHIDDIVKLTFQYINMIKDTGPLLWIQDEQKHIAAMTFNFKDKESPRSYIVNIIHNIHDYPMDDILCAHYLMSEWNPDMIKKLLSDFSPENVRIELIAKQYAAIADQKEPWYGTEYKLSKIPECTINDWNEAGLCPDLRIPDKNDFIPEKFNLFDIEKDNTDHPLIIKDTAISRVWYKQDDKFLLPKANLMFDIVSPFAYLDPLNCNLTHMFTSLFKDALNQYAYAAELAGIKWDLNNTKYGLILAIGGFNDKQDVFLDKIMETLTSFKVDKKRFDIFKENYIRSLKNFAAEQPYQHAVYYLALLMTEHSWSKQELLAATDQLSIEQLEAFIPQLFSRMHIECLIHGNVNRKDALHLVDIVENRITENVQISPLLPRQLLLNRELRLDAGNSYLYEVENSVHRSSCIELYYQCGLQNIGMNVLLELFAQIVQEPCFNILRTKEQLGYIVFSGVRRSSGVQGMRIIVQSDKHPTYVDLRIEDFLSGMQKYITEMSDEDFNKHKEALAAHRLEKPKQLSTQSYIYWSEITAQQYHFDRTPVEVAHLRTLTKEDILNFYKDLISADSSNRHKIAVHVVSTVGGENGIDLPIPVEPQPEAKEPIVICDVTTFKSAHEMHALVQPYMTISRKGNKCKL